MQSFISDDLLLNCFRLGQKTESSLPNLPQPALEEAKIFLDFLAWRYQINFLLNSLASLF
uniref:Uncharacterized protein n=1 Tax=Planktothrix agardhii TaxID=1160 RepID=A0A1J1JK18_PLAAG|nr:protein of unknown function [Planktothrix agardhii]